MSHSITEKNTPIVPVRIYLIFTKAKGIIHIKQYSKNLDGSCFLIRRTRARKPYEKHMRIALNGTIQTTVNSYKKHYKKRITHIGIYLSNTSALSILEEIAKPNYKKKNINLTIVKKD